MALHAVFLRGINLGGKRRVGMADLRAALERAGYGDVRTHLQSGNVLLSSDASPAELEPQLEALLHDEFGFEIAVMVRSREQLAAVVAHDPFGEVADDPARYVVSFLAAKPDRAAITRLKHAAEPPERVAVRGREVYAWHPGGVGRSELAKAIDERRLGVGVTARNWRTVTKLLELAEDASS